MTRKVVAWLLAGVLGVSGLAVWGLWTSRLGRDRAQVALELEQERQRNFHELVGHMQSIQGLLGKGTAAGSVPQNQLYMSEVYRRTSLATANFMALPLPGPISASMGKFLNQTGDFAYSIARNEAAGRAMDPKQRTELTRLQQSAEQLARDLQVVGQQASQKGFRWVGAGPTLATLFRRTPPSDTAHAPAGGAQAPKNLLPGGMEAIGPQMDRMPMMAYDGPFSDHLKERKPALTGAPISEEQARSRAVTFIPDGKGYTVAGVTKKNGKLKSFSVALKPTAAGAGNSVTVDLTQEGGYLAAFINSRRPGSAKLTLQQARDAGKRYLDEHGFENMVPTYGEAVDGLATVQYAVRHQSVMVYPDQVKMRVALDTGEILGIDARQYIMNHRERGRLEVPAVSQADAAKTVNPNLKVERVQLALIPTEAGDNEVLTYEFMGRLGNDTYMVYVNAKSGAEERILQVLMTKTGTLAL